MLFQLSSGLGGYGNYGFLASGMLMLIGVDVDFQRQFRAACGYAELGMTTESIAELNVIDDEHQGRPEVLQLRLHHLMRKKQWTRAASNNWQSEGQGPCAKPTGQLFGSHPDADRITIQC